MKFNVSSSALSNSLQAISRVISSKNSMPILDCFLFEIQGNILKLTASDTETTLFTSTELTESDGDFRFAIKAKNILEALKEIPEQPIDFEIEAATLGITINYMNGHYNTVAQNADEYPVSAPLEDSAVSISLPANDLLNSINRTLFAGADDDLRPVMTGVFFDIQPEQITFVASDGHKLVRDTRMGIHSDTTSSFILPKKPANILRALLSNEQSDAVIRFDDRNAIVSVEHFTMICRLIEGRYPNYNSVIPTDNPNHIIVDRASLLSTLRRVLIFTSQSTALVKLRLEINRMTVSGQDIDLSTSAEENLSCQYDGMPMSIGFKGTFLIDILNNIGGDEIMLELADPSRAGVIVPTKQEENEDVLMLLMPMMLND
jgi:DNA polymerase-3 subunit beta